MTHDGLVVIDKPIGPTSHDVIDAARRIYGQRKIGHTGTLDPGASGVLVLCLGRATRLVRFLQPGPKVYTGRFVLGITTDTFDADGAETSRRACGAEAERVEAVMAALTGTISQTPPMVSAVKVGGRKLYEAARAGDELERAPRTVHVERFDVTGFEQGDFPVVQFEVECGKGTYVRSLAAEAGERLACGAHILELRRTLNGAYSIEQAHKMDELASSARAASDALIALDAIDVGIPELHLSDVALRRVAHGVRLTSEEHPELADFGCEGPVAIRREGRLIAVYRVHREGDAVQAVSECVLVSGEAGERAS